MKRVLITFLIGIATLSAGAQDLNTVLATANGRSFTVADLPIEMQQSYLNLFRSTPERFAMCAEQSVFNDLIQLEAGARGLTVGELFEKEIKSKRKEPDDAEARSFYNGLNEEERTKTFEELKPEILEHLRSQADFEAARAFFDRLAEEWKMVIKIPWASTDLKPGDVMVTLLGKSMTYGYFQELCREQLYQWEGIASFQLKDMIRIVVFNYLLDIEAQTTKKTKYELFQQAKQDWLTKTYGVAGAVPILTGKRALTESESQSVDYALRLKLFLKYNAKFSVKLPTAAPVYNVATSDDPSLGPAKAPVTIVMFSDLQCGSCAYWSKILKDVMSAYPGKVRLIIRDFPLQKLHKNALPAAIAANAAAKQGKYFEYIDLVYENQDKLDPESLKNYAKKIGLDIGAFESDLKDPKLAAEVNEDVREGDALSVSETPTLFINGVKLRRFYDAERDRWFNPFDGSEEEWLRDAIEEALEKGTKPLGAASSLQSPTHTSNSLLPLRVWLSNEGIRAWNLAPDGMGVVRIPVSMRKRQPLGETLGFLQR